MTSSSVPTAGGGESTCPVRDMLKTAPAFIAEMVDELELRGVALANLDIDHLCFRCATDEEYIGFCSIVKMCTESYLF